jgi:hypothetical protein
LAGEGNPPGEPLLAVTVDRDVALYRCANHHQTVVPFISTTEVPGQRVCTSRGQADGDRLMAELLRRRDHPEEFTDVWTAGPSPRRRPDQSSRSAGLTLDHPSKNVTTWR